MKRKFKIISLLLIFGFNVFIFADLFAEEEEFYACCECDEGATAGFELGALCFDGGGPERGGEGRAACAAYGCKPAEHPSPHHGWCSVGSKTQCGHMDGQDWVPGKIYDCPGNQACYN